MRRRVVVTGMGCITPVGHDVHTMWKSLCEGRSGVGNITSFDASNFPTRFAAEVRDFRVEDYCDNPQRFDAAGRNVRFAVAAAAQAVKDSGVLDSSLNPAEFGVYLGAGEGQQDFLLFMSMVAEAQRNGELDLEQFTRAGLERLDPRSELEQEPNMPSGHLASLFNTHGPNLNFPPGGPPPQPANGQRAEIIPPRGPGRLLSGGAHSMIHPFGVTGFNL